MMKKNLTLAAFILSVLAFLFAVSGNRAAPLPHDAVHGGSLDTASCSACHSPGKQVPRKNAHPPEEQCLVCHAASKDCHPCPLSGSLSSGPGPTARTFARSATK